MPTHEPTHDQLDALHVFAELHGRNWRHELITLWQNGTEQAFLPDRAAELRQVRNSFGPGWLQRFKPEPLFWTSADRETALAEGWDLFQSCERGLEIQRDDEAAIFEDDEAAIAHVRTRAEAGCKTARKALASHHSDLEA